MLNSDLIAFLQPVPNRFNTNEWRDACGRVQDISVNAGRLTIRLRVAPGIYKGRIETRAGAFDMNTAMVEMTRVPDFTRHLTGPWDLDGFHYVMAMPMARVRVNGHSKGGLWFSMPGPEQIAEGRLAADFGFETEQEETELVLEFIERDQARLAWSAMQSLELRCDERRLAPLIPLENRRAPLYLETGDKSTFRGTPRFQEMLKGIHPENSHLWMDRFSSEHNIFDLVCLAAWITEDAELETHAKNALLDFCRKPTWSGQPDPLLMGGDNDRIIGQALYVTAMGWEYLKPLLNDEERAVVLSKAEEYLQKMYDFTLLQRGYMGCPSPDPHSLGTWFGVGAACMSFYQDLAIARHALPFFHGLFLESLKLFPPSGKAAWATYFPFWLVRYLAAASTFGGPIGEMDDSIFLDNLGQALLSCFMTPNAQETQRGLRTVEHRFITAFLCRFHPTPGIENIYSAFVEQERQTAGDVKWGFFDLLYAPPSLSEPATFPAGPVYARDIGEIVSIHRGEKTISTLLAGGMPAGAAASFYLRPHNREFHRPMGEITMRVDDAPVLIEVMGYGLHSANKNTLCLEDGCGVAEGQYLNGDIAPEKCSFIRRCLLDERFIYADINLTGAIKPDLEVQYAQRTVLLDRQTGVIVIADSFQSRKPLQFSTHLHCSGSAREIDKSTFRLTGGQANLIAGIKGGSKGLSDDEAGEIFVQVLETSMPHRIRTEEPHWFPSYIYGVNSGAEEKREDARFPRLTRWRLEGQDRISQGQFVFALTPEPEMVSMQNDWMNLGGTRYSLNPDGSIELPNGSCIAEAVIIDDNAKRSLLLGATTLNFQDAKIEFNIPVDIQFSFADAVGQGNIYSPSAQPVLLTEGINIELFEHVTHQTMSIFEWTASFSN
jgi:hypothetical protein